MRFYVACLASYNDGILHGAWIEASSDVDEMQTAINAMLRASPRPNVRRQTFLDAEGEEHTVNIDPGFTKPDDWTPQGEPFASAEEWAIHDHEGAWAGMGEFPSLAKIAAWVEVLELAEDRDIPEDVAAELAIGDSEDFSGTREAIEDNFQGGFQSLADWAEDFEDQAGDLKAIPDRIRYHIDWESMGRDAELGGNIRSIRGNDGTLYIFWNH